MNERLLLLSNSTNAGEEYLNWPREHIASFLAGKPDVLFIPYAGFALGYDNYEKRVNDVFSELGIKLQSIHQSNDPVSAVEKAGAIAVGGGNTFYLFRELYRNKLIGPIRRKVLNGTPYIGWSAGSNTACPSLKTSNDMPIVEPESFDGLNVVPFQVNPHYTDKQIAGHGGESRDQRIHEFLAANPSVPVIGLRESTLLHVEKNNLQLKGEFPLKLFTFGKKPREFKPGENINFLLDHA